MRVVVGRHLQADALVQHAAGHPVELGAAHLQHRHAAVGGAYSLLRFPDQDLPDVVYVEQLTSAVYLDKRADVEDYVLIMERVTVQAETPAQSRETLRRLLGEL